MPPRPDDEIAMCFHSAEKSCPPCSFSDINLDVAVRLVGLATLGFNGQVGFLCDYDPEVYDDIEVPDFNSCFLNEDLI